jgi:hypothetical protein
MSASGYEFTADQNKLIGSLAGKMRFVGLFAVVLGVINLILALLVVAAVYRDRLTPEWKNKTNAYLEKTWEKLPEEARKQSEPPSLDKLDKLPPNEHLWGIAIGSAFTGLFYLLMGVWTRSAGAAFQKIVDTQGSDIKHLMDGMGSLHQMYTLLYTLLIVVLLAGIISLGLTLYRYLVP